MAEKGFRKEKVSGGHIVYHGIDVDVFNVF